MAASSKVIDRIVAVLVEEGADTRVLCAALERLTAEVKSSKSVADTLRRLLEQFKLIDGALAFRYRRANDIAGEYRWWRSDWFSDQFDVISPEELKNRIKDCKLKGINCYEADDE